MTSPDQKQTAHTAGQWEISAVLTVDEEFMVCGGEGQGFGLIAIVVREEDAHVVAAAPDLLEAAQKLMASINEMDPEQRGCSTVAYAEMWEAIARATRSSSQSGGE